jgi:RHS repeat-associated protein
MYDILRNTLTKGSSVSYSWDSVNRMTSATIGNTTWNYAYRADGIRMTKKRGAGGEADTYYRYDGQMPREEFFWGSEYPRDYVQTIRYGLGARGVDYIERISTVSPTVVGFPLYDGHGNMVGTLMRSGSGYSLNDRRTYDAWGSIHSGNSTGEPNQRYCANMGHMSDDESGLIYMRARYYEPGSGRFVSEDPAMDGLNWYVYCKNTPTSLVDLDGRFALSSVLLKAIVGIVKFLLGHLLMDMTEPLSKRIQNIERYMAQLDELIAHGNTASSWGADQLAMRKEYMNLQKVVKRLKFYEGVRRIGTRIGSVFVKLLGYSFIISALIADIDLGIEGFGSLDSVYGGG